MLDGGTDFSLCSVFRKMNSLDTAARNLRHAVRTLTRNKATYLSAIGILALGIGMSVAMFSLADAVLLRPLPFPRQESIQLIWKVDPLAGKHVEELAYPELRDLEENIPDFEYVAVMPTSLYGYAKVLQTGTAEPVQIESAPVSHDFFQVLGISPVLGRGFTSSDERVGAAPVVVISDRVWRDQLGRDPNIIGSIIRLNGQGHTVIGVMARGVEFPRGAGLWIPLGIEQRIVERRGATFLQAIARTRPGVSRERIAVQANALFQRLAVDHPEAYSRSQQAVVTPLVEYWTGSARLHLWIMLGASLLLLIASIISAGNLLLSRILSAPFRNRHTVGAGGATQSDPGAIRCRGRSRRDPRGVGWIGPRSLGDSMVGQIGTHGHPATGGRGFGPEQLLFRGRCGGNSCAGMHVDPRMGGHANASGGCAARRRRKIVMVSPRRKNQAHLHSGPGSRDGNAAGYRLPAGVELPLHDLRRHRIRES